MTSMMKKRFAFLTPVCFGTSSTKLAARSLSVGLDPALQAAPVVVSGSQKQKFAPDKRDTSQRNFLIGPSSGWDSGLGL
eukprot:CAMPEP_0194776614 /NCGR_PEP_ID=MMETSP0323_2-20130528/63569_1 /TAXON_ID=2866 ORGANISM="Crypthecodinium cohnii, Strain Seligo" /NCGR_SAMPLE_ID=MMETSP0323_2 /ASSEMBLY_ACC=CAM_ASM_000346 /LENGTH=78 /DNA_ID=CAMNT_0039713091 /DNA_START=160 /DNA_END=396 /DNA_ORIENTATION=-